MGFWQKSSREGGANAPKSSKSKKLPIWLMGLCVGVLFLGIGAYEEQFTDLYRKAVMICLECIGIG